jgi:hypothetical protein
MQYKYRMHTTFQSNMNTEDKHCKIGERWMQHSRACMQIDIHMLMILNSKTTEMKKTQGSDLGTESEWEVWVQAEMSGGARCFDVGSWKY